MFPKILAIILAVGATACALLVNRQQRIDAAHEISIAHHRILANEHSLWRIRGDIAERVRPERVREQIGNEVGAWAAIPAIPSLAPGDKPLLRIALSSPVADTFAATFVIDDEPQTEDYGG